MTMTNIKSLMLAAVTALSLGVGTAMAQESAGDRPGPYETMELKQMLAQQAAAAKARTAQASTAEPQYGSSDRIATPDLMPTLEGGGG
jgi:energy-converting hydrogenase Eha subunit F